MLVHTTYCWYELLHCKLAGPQHICYRLACFVQIENNKLAEALARRKAEHTVLTQKRHRLEQQLNHQAKEAKSLNLAATRLHVDLQRINALIADHATLRMALEEENLQLQGRATNELRDMEEEAARWDT